MKIFLQAALAHHRIQEVRENNPALTGGPFFRHNGEMTKPYHKSRAGFTLLELSISIAILAILLTTVLSAYNANQTLLKQKQLKEQLEVIRAALVAFRNANDYLPCPADGTLAYTNASYGQQVTRNSSSGVCTGANLGPWGGVPIYGGVLPVKTLGLPDMLDPWGHRFTYWVPKTMTKNAAFTQLPPNQFTDAQAILVDNIGGSTPKNAAVAVISHGPNGHGAYLPGGGRFLLSSAQTSEEANNCGCNTNGSAFDNEGHLTLTPYNQGDASGLNNFDDQGFALGRGDLLAPEEKR